MLLTGTPLDDFLSDAGSSTVVGDRLQRFGFVLGMVGTLLAVGLLLFVAAVWRGRSVDRRLLLRVAMIAGACAATGGVVEIAGIASIFDIGWDDALGSALGRAPMMRMMGGALVVVGLHESFGSDEPDAAAWQIEPSAFFAFAGAAFAALSFGFDGHTTTEGQRVLHAVVNAVHVGAAGAWVGGVVALGLLAVRGGLRGDGLRLLHRFASVATVAIVAVGLAGLVMAVMVLDGVGELTSTEWGRLLIVKSLLVAVAGAIGAYHHFRVVPMLDRAGLDAASARHVNRSLVVEAVVLVVVALVSGWLATASTV